MCNLQTNFSWFSIQNVEIKLQIFNFHDLFACLQRFSQVNCWFDYQVFWSIFFATNDLKSACKPTSNQILESNRFAPQSFLGPFALATKYFFLDYKKKNNVILKEIKVMSIFITYV